LPLAAVNGGRASVEILSAILRDLGVSAVRLTLIPPSAPFSRAREKGRG